MGEKKIFEQLIDKKTLAKELGISPRSIDSMMKDRGLPYHKIGSMVRFKVSDVEKWLKDRKVVHE